MDLQRNNDAIALLSPKSVDNSAIELYDLKIKLYRYLPSHKVKTFYENKLRSGEKALLPTDRSFLKTYTVKSGTFDLTLYQS